MNPAFMRKTPRKNAREPFGQRYRFTLGTAFLIMIVVLLPGRTFDGVQIQIPYLDKIIHFFMFFTFCMAFSLEYRKDRRALPRFLPLLALLAAFALATETSQLFAQGRSFDLVDGLFDLFGAVMARILIGLFDHIGRQPVSAVFRPKDRRKKL